MSTIETPLHTLDQRDEAVPVNVPDASINFADNPEAMRYLQENIYPMLTTVRDDGASIRDEWMAIRRMSLMQHDDGQTYKGMSNAYLPVYARSLDVRVSHISQALFPSDDYVDVRQLDESNQWMPASPNGMTQAEVLKAWMGYQFERQMRFRVTVKPFLRQLYDFGISAGKIWYEKQLTKRAMPGLTRNRALALAQQAIASQGARDPMLLAAEGCRFQTRNMMTWHMWPPTVDNIRQATLVFEDIQVNKQYIETVGKQQGWRNLEQAVWAPQPSNANSDLQLQQDAVRFSPTTATDFQRMGEVGQWSWLTEAYFLMPVPSSLYLPNEDPGTPVPVRALIAGNVPVLIQRNPFWFQHAPYVVRKHGEMPDSFYGIGMGRIARSLQYLANDFMNQTNDNATYGLNPVSLFNPNLVAGPLEPIAPGRNWAVTDINQAHKFDRPPIEQMGYGLQILSWLSGQMNDLLGTPPILQGTNSKGVAKTATGAQLLQQNVSTDLQDEVTEIEQDVLIPLMDMAHKLGQQYQQDDLSLATSGGTIRVRRDDLVGQFSFQWLASSQLQNKQMRASQAMQLLQTIMPMVPLLQQQGKTFNPMPLLERVGKDALGFRDFDKCFVPVPTPMLGAPGQPGAPGAEPPGPEEEGGGAEPDQDNAAGISAVPQAAGGGPRAGMDVAAGEGGAFGQVRDQADALSAMMGAQNG